MQFLILIVLLSFIQANIITTKGYKETLKLIEQDPDFLAISMIIGDDCDDCYNSLKIYENFAEQVHPIIRSYLIDCADLNEKLSICDPKVSHLLPKITFLQPSDKDEPNEYDFQGTVSERALMEYVDKYAPINSVVAQDTELFESLFLKDKSIPCKVVLIKNQDKLPLWWKGLTAEFKDRLDFGEIDKDDKHVYKKYKVENSLLILEFDEDRKKYQQHIYKGKLNFENLKQYLSQFALAEKVQKVKNIYEQKLENWKKVYNLDFKQLKRILNLNDQWILIQFNDKNNATTTQFKQIQNKFKNLIKYYMVDCTSKKCYYEKDSLAIFSLNKKNLISPIYIRSDDDINTVIENMQETLLKTEECFEQVNKEHMLPQLKFFRQEQGYLPILWFYDSQDPFQILIGSTLSAMAKYKKYLKIFFFKDPSNEDKEHWTITKLPKLIAFREVNLDTGYHLKLDFTKKPTIENLIGFLNDMSLDNEKEILAEIPSPKNQEEFELYCINGYNKCVIAFLETMKEGKFKQDMEILKQLRQHYKDLDLTWLWIDGRCHKSESDLSTLILLNPSKGKYLKYENDFVLEKLVHFVDLSNDKKTKMKKLDESIELEVNRKERDCEKMRKEIREEYKQQKNKRKQKNDDL